MSREIVNLVEAYETKYNAEGNAKGRRIAHREIGNAVRGLLESKKLNPDLISFAGLYRKLVEEMDLMENIVSSAFPTIASEVISNVIIQAYQAFPKFGDRLVRTVPSRVEESKVPGWTAIGFIRKLKEREPYSQAAPPEEKIFRIRSHKYGGTMDLTKEAIFFDKTGQLMDRARGIGEEAARTREQIIMETVIDALSEALNYGPLYTSGNGNLIGTNPLGVAGWENVHTNLLEKKDEKNKPIWVMGDRPILLCAPNLWPKAEKLVRNEKVAGDNGEYGNDENLARNMYDTVINQYMASGSTDWFYGAFNRQFRWEEVWPLETYTRIGQDTEEGFKQDVIQQFKASFFGGCGATDTRFVVKSTAA